MEVRLGIVDGLLRSGLATSEEVVFVGVRLLAANMGVRLLRLLGFLCVGAVAVGRLLRHKHLGFHTVGRRCLPRHYVVSLPSLQT